MRLCLYHILVNKTLLSELCACMQYLFNTGVIWRGFLNKSLFANKCSETLKHKQKQKKKNSAQCRPATHDICQFSARVKSSPARCSHMAEHVSRVSRHPLKSSRRHRVAGCSGCGNPHRDECPRRVDEFPVTCTDRRRRASPCQRRTPTTHNSAGRGSQLHMWT